MKHIFLIIITAMALFSSCKKKHDIVQTELEFTDTIQVDGMNRTFIVELPEDWKNLTMPLVFALHGGSGTAAGMETMTSFKTVAQREKFILIYPQGIDKSWNDGRPTAANRKGIDDVKFFSTMIDHLRSKYTIDGKKIYVCGISNGGFMTSRLAIELSDKFAAGAADAATINVDLIPNMHPGPVSMIYMHGDADPLVPFTGGSTGIGPAAEGVFVSHQGAIDKWVSVNQCDSMPTITNLPDIAKDGTTVVKYEYKNGLQGTAVTGYTIQNGGHTWPGGWQYLPSLIIGKTSRDINATEIIWAFFKEHPKQ